MGRGQVRAVEGSKVVGGIASRVRSGTLADQTKAGGSHSLGNGPSDTLDPADLGSLKHKRGVPGS